MVTVESDFLTVLEASKYLKMSRGTVYHLVSQRRIPFYKKTGKLYFKKADLRSWVESGKKV